MNRARLLAACALVAAGCSLDLRSNDAYCESDGDCPAGRTCVRFEGRDDGLCVATADPDGGAMDAGDDAGRDAGMDGGPSCVADTPCYGGPPDTEGVGICAGGSVVCSDTGVASCVGDVTPEADDPTCDGVDQDCDGTEDEDAPAMGNCMIGEPGICAMGERRCFQGAYGCRPIAEATPEVCNGMDDDCDSVVDEDADAQCYEGTSGCAPQPDGTYVCTGVCLAGQQACESGSLAVECVGDELEAAEACTTAPGTAFDESCDGMIDEGCTCTDGETQPCYPGPRAAAGVGACTLGSQTCSGGAWGACTGAILPSDETCDPGSAGVDDDCNGVVDDVPGVGGGCLDETAMGICRSGVLECDAGGAIACVTPMPRTEEPFCDGRDDDCDGTVDENFDTMTDEEHCGGCGLSCGEGRSCCGGGCTFTDDDELNCGACGTMCAPNEGCCGGGCIDVMMDRNNCGACGNVCPGTQACCMGTCVDTRSDEANCGTCGMGCTGTDECCDGVCAAPDAPQCTGCTMACGSDTCCAPSCVDLATDPANCGGCGDTDPSFVCSGATDTCCGGGCTDTDTDVTHCGTCGNACDASAPDCCGGSCVDRQTDERNCGACGTVCDADETCCGGACVDTETDVLHCGACGADCPGGQLCSEGNCCPTGQTWCDAAGACVDLDSNAAHCGACGMACGAGQTCCGGACANTATDEMNCGTCGTICGATETCCGGSCVDLQTSTSHCGLCGRSCAAGDLCCSGSCKDIQNDRNFCGSCTNNCTGLQNCCDGVCGVCL